MDDRRGRERSIPWGLVGAIALIAGTERAIDGMPARFADTASLSWRLALGSAANDGRSAEVACLGDSLIKIGLIPAAVGSSSGLRTRNFAMAQAPAPATYFLLRRLLDAGARPKALVVDFKPSVLVGGPRHGLHLYQGALSIGEAFDLAATAESPRLLLEILAGRLIPSARSRLEIREAIRFATFGLEPPTATNNRLAIRNWSRNDGAHVNNRAGRFAGPIDADHLRRLAVDRWKVDPTNARYVDRLLDLADARGIPVFWLLPPLPPELQAARERSGVDAAYTRFARDRQAAHPGVTILDARRSGYTAAEFADATHLSGRGAEALSDDLGRLLRTAGRGGWVELPAFRERPVDPRIEEIDGSRLALDRERAAVSRR